MRYYSIRITNPATGRVVVPNSLARLGYTDTTYTSFLNGRSLPGALNIEMDVVVVPFGTPAGGSFIRIQGVSLQEIGQSSDLNGFQIAVYGGMQKGLPLANPLQAGLLLQGNIFQAFGNYIGTDMSLDLIISADDGTIEKPKNIVHFWLKGTPLKDAIEATLTTAFPGYTADIEISPNLVYTEDSVGYYQTVEQYAAYIEDVSKAIIGGTYDGVKVSLTEKTFFVYDGSLASVPRQIEFKDLIGQPTWIGPGMMQFKCAMRADIVLGDTVKLPQGLVTTNASAQASQIDLKSSFQGSFLVNQVRHAGNFRQPDAESWVTVIDAAAQNIT